MATYGTANGGKWQMLGDKASGKLFTEPESSALTTDGWQIVSKNWNSR
jgi:hypothetical protein